jgi:hypothetical protein
MTEKQIKSEIFEGEIVPLFAESGWSRFDAQHWLEANMSPTAWESIGHEGLRALAEKYYNAPARRP